MSAQPVPQVLPDHHVVVRLVKADDGSRAAVPTIDSTMQVGETVRYSVPMGG